MSAYIDDELTERQSAAVAEHVSHCAGCKEELETLRAALALLVAPRAMVRPEGLLEEFKARYLPEAETTPAPRWGIRLPVLPAIEWPSLRRIMAPMGGLAAAAAAAALVVAVHTQPIAVGRATIKASHTNGQVAVLPPLPATSETDARPEGPDAAHNLKEAPRHATAASAGDAPKAGHARTHFGVQRGLSHRSSPHRRLHHGTASYAVTARSQRRSRHRPAGYQLARRDHLAPVVDPALLKRAVSQHESAVPSPEMQWQDQVVVIRRSASPAPSDDGYGEASCKDLATGQTEKSIAIGGSPAPTTPAPSPAGETGGGN